MKTDSSTGQHRLLASIDQTLFLPYCSPYSRSSPFPRPRSERFVTKYCKWSVRLRAIRISKAFLFLRLHASCIASSRPGGFVLLDRPSSLRRCSPLMVGRLCTVHDWSCSHAQEIHDSSFIEVINQRDKVPDSLALGCRVC